MKLVSITWKKPVATVELLQGEIELLCKCSAVHYDAVCRRASVPGPEAFLNDWKNRLQGPNNTRVMIVEVEGDFRTFDTAAKILELSGSVSEQPDEALFRHDLREKLRLVLKALNEFRTDRQITKNYGT